MGTSIPNLFPNRFQESIFHPLTRLQIPAQYDNPIPTRFLAPIDFSNIPVLSFELYRQKLLAGKEQENSQIF